MPQRKKSYLFSWEQYRDESWWHNLRVEATRRGVSINQLLCDLLDRWLAHGNAAPDMLYGRPRNTGLTPLQQQAFDMRRQGLKIREIAHEMGRQPENVRQLLARAANNLNIPGGWTGIKKRRCEMREYNFQRDLVDGKAKVEVGQCLTNRKLGRLRVIRAGDPYMVDGDSDDDAGRSGGGFRAGERFMRQDYVCVREGD